MVLQEEISDEKTALYSNNAPGHESNFQESLREREPDDKPVERKKSFWADASTQQKLVFALIVYGHTSVYICVSVPFAFIANYIVARGGVKEDATLVAELVMLSMAISSVFFGAYQIKIGTKNLFWGGILCFGLSQSLLCVMEYAPNAATLVIIGCIINIVQGMGNGAYAVAALTIICQEFPDHAVTAFGIAETFASVGYTCGPLIGGVLFSISNGLILPFCISMVPLIPVFLLGFCYLKDYETSSYIDENIRSTDLMKKPACMLVLGMAMSVFGNIGMSDVLSPVYLAHRGFSVTEVGWALVLFGACYAMSSFLVAFISDIGNKSRRAVMLVGYLGICGIPFALTRTQTKAGAYVALAASGCFSGFALISSFGELMHAAVGNQVELRTSLALHSILSGMWNFTYGIGIFFFPVIGASLLRVTHYEFAVFTIVILGLCLAAVVALALVAWQHCTKRATNNAEY